MTTKTRTAKKHETHKPQKQTAAREKTQRTHLKINLRLNKLNTRVYRYWIFTGYQTWISGVQYPAWSGFLPDQPFSTATMKKALQIKDSCLEFLQFLNILCINVQHTLNTKPDKVLFKILSNFLIVSVVFLHYLMTDKLFVSECTNWQLNADIKSFMWLMYMTKQLSAEFHGRETTAHDGRFIALWNQWDYTTSVL